jgi:hypothetical protein
MGAVAAERLVERLRTPGRPFLNIGVRMAFDTADAGVGGRQKAQAAARK